MAHIVKYLNGLVAGIRAFHADGDPGDAAGGLRDGPRLHLRHPQAPAHDHLRRGEGAHTGSNKLPSIFTATKIFSIRQKKYFCAFYQNYFPFLEKSLLYPGPVKKQGGEANIWEFHNFERMFPTLIMGVHFV